MQSIAIDNLLAAVRAGACANSTSRPTCFRRVDQLVSEGPLASYNGARRIDLPPNDLAPVDEVISCLVKDLS